MATLCSHTDFQCQLLASVQLRVNRNLMLLRLDTLPELKLSVLFLFFVFFYQRSPTARAGIRSALIINILIWSTFTLLLQSRVCLSWSKQLCQHTWAVMTSSVALDHDGVSSPMAEGHAAHAVTQYSSSTSYIYLSFSRVLLSLLNVGVFKPF